jgi:hypothetical protein
MKEEILQKIEENIEKIRGFGIKKIGIFGSWVRDEQRKESDLDILIEFEDGKKTFDNYMDLKFFLEDLFGHKVDLVVREAIKPRLKPYIMSEVRYAKGL